MFERFTGEARDVVIDARHHAVRLGHRHIGTEHLLLALFAPNTDFAELLREHNVTVARVESARADYVAQNKDPVESDHDALAVLGIDLAQVQDAVDSAFGTGALETARHHRSGHRPRRWQRRRRVCATSTTHTIPFTPRSKKALELSLREALRLKHKFIGPEHLALGILREGEGLACLILVRQGIALDGLRVSLEDMLKRAA